MHSNLTDGGTIMQSSCQVNLANWRLAKLMMVMLVVVVRMVRMLVQENIFLRPIELWLLSNWTQKKISINVCRMLFNKCVPQRSNTRASMHLLLEQNLDLDTLTHCLSLWWWQWRWWGGICFEATNYSESFKSFPANESWFRGLTTRACKVFLIEICLGCDVLALLHCHSMYGTLEIRKFFRFQNWQ